MSQRSKAYFVSMAQAFTGLGIQHAESMDRLAIREEISEHEVTLSQTAARAGVDDFRVLRLPATLACMEMDYHDIRRLRTVSEKPRRSVLDFMGKDGGY